MTPKSDPYWLAPLKSKSTVSGDAAPPLTGIVTPVIGIAVVSRPALEKFSVAGNPVRFGVAELSTVPCRLHCPGVAVRTKNSSITCGLPSESYTVPAVVFV